jgi:type I restriction enzyme M protein
VLFAELCVRQAKRDGGRIAIILPNGYLGNRGERYRRLRHWLLCQTRIVAVIAFPRFTFKKSGADVSASVLFMERRKKPLDDPKDSEKYPVYVNLLESVGWEISNKGAKRIVKRNPMDGAAVLDKNNEPVIDADFDDVLKDLYASPVVDAFPWLAEGIPGAGAADGWSVGIEDIVSSNDLLLDPKRLCRKYRELRDAINDVDHLSILDICDVVPQGKFKKQKSNIYRYVELTDVHRSSVEYTELRGWELPGRAKHLAEKGDIFIGAIWGSVGKWFMAGADADKGDLVVTNGCHRLKVKEGKEDLLPDLVFALSSEFYRVQARAMATGSDGLADVSEGDLGKIIIPRLKDATLREKISQYIHQARDEITSPYVLSSQMMPVNLKAMNVPPRRWAFSQV